MAKANFQVAKKAPTFLIFAGSWDDHRLSMTGGARLWKKFGKPPPSSSSSGEWLELQLHRAQLEFVSKLIWWGGESKIDDCLARLGYHTFFLPLAPKRQVFVYELESDSFFSALFFASRTGCLHRSEMSCFSCIFFSFPTCLFFITCARVAIRLWLVGIYREELLETAASAKKSKGL